MLYIRPIKLKAITIVMALFLFVVLSKSSIASTEEALVVKEASLRFTLPDELGFPMSEEVTHFDCLDKIYAVSIVEGFDKGKHAIEFKWVAPDGETRERTIYDFYVREKPETKLWAWLQLSRAQGAGMIQWLNPAAGLEEFIGNWKVEVLIDDKSYSSAEFEVSC